MDRRGSGRWRCALLLASWLLAAGCAPLPQAPGLIGSAGLVTPHRVGFEVSTIGYHDPHDSSLPLLPGYSFGLRHRLTDHLAGGLTLFLSGEAAVDLKAAFHLGPRVVLSLDPRLMVGELLWVSTPDGCSASGAAAGCGQGPPVLVGGDLPLAVGIRIGPDQLILDTEVSTWRTLGTAPNPGVYGAVALGLDAPIAKVFVLPQIELVCGTHPLGWYVSGGGCYETLTVTLHN